MLFRCFKQCKERYENQLNPNINKSEFTNDEINLIIQKQKEFGNKWKKKRALVNNRTEDKLKINGILLKIKLKKIILLMIFLT